MTQSSNQISKTRWSSTFAFLMAMIGSAVGLGNIWRFNYVVYSNGGGAFFIPYLCAIIFMGVPFLLIEYGVGYKFRDSFSNILKKIKPCFEVLGWLVMLFLFLDLSYYMIVLGWDCIYFILSFFKGWGADPNMFFNANLIVGGMNLDSLTTFVLPVTAVTIILWAVLWYISHKSIDAIEKTVKILIPLMFFLMIFIVFYSLTLPGHDVGLQALFTPDWSALGNIDIWLAAFGQVLYSLSMGEAVALTYASYLPEGSKLIDNLLVVVASNSFFEIFTAVGVFSILGYMALETGCSVGQVATSGTGLLFIAFPQVFNIMGNFAYILGPVFFLCVLFAGLTSIVGMFEPIVNAMSAKFGLSRTKAATIVGLIGLCVSLIYTTGSGNFILTVVDEFFSEFALLLGVILQVIIFGWFYSIEKIVPILNENSSIHVGKKWIFTIKFLLPIILTIIWLSGVAGLIGTQDGATVLIEAVVTVMFIVVPIVLTLLPEKKSDVNLNPAIEESS
ncbi:MAG: sodium-dependent transporter [Methanosphaera sp.]|uniref:sodium-dependent transporter n=1 Tax=Methanosphaera sp. TaxID=2666342 RepID=UPI0025DF7C9E|nr:sodium-dependent transporter [Methanosphaera sp.]MCI5866953.1 sodium-dependent transporter [Methanosphaera sp.]MDD6535106.1 sodium-dependent transporter [Methanosphaera sp.]MDY3955916.1 sodium-dependent transporter [Methanosphaera sp.]